MSEKRCGTAVCALMFGVSLLVCGVTPAGAQTVVTYQTEDGVTIQSTLHLPATPRAPLTGVVLFAEPGWIVRATYDSMNVARDLATNYGVAALTVDFRGTAANAHGRHIKTFSPADKEKLQLDVRAAVKFLGSQKGMDPRRIGVLAVGEGANYALLEAAENPAIQALVLLSGTLSDRALAYIESRSDIPVLCLAGKDDKKGVRQMAEAFSLSQNRNSDFVVARAGHGTVMFNRTEGLAKLVARWLAENLKGLGTDTEISFATEDGWKLHGRLRLPDGAAAGATVPGVVLVHGAMHDQETYYDLARALTKKGLATLTYDWRGKNRDPKENRGHYGVNLSQEEQDKTPLDVKAAINFMASQPGVDPNRIGVVAATMGTTYALHGVSGDPRVKTMALLSQYVLDDAARNFLKTTDIPIFLMASAEDLNFEAGNLSDFTREAYLLSKNKQTEFLLWDDAGRGSEMLKRKPEMEPMIVRWFVDKLGAQAGTRSSR